MTTDSKTLPLFEYSRSPDIVFLLALLGIWSVLAIFQASRIDRYGAYATHSVEHALRYITEHGGHPEAVRLWQSYSDWARNLNLTDSSQYIKVGLGWAEGKGISTKDISPEYPNSKSFTPYWWQSPGTGFVIGLFIKLFGEDHVLPYFIFICCVYFGCAIATYFLACEYVLKRYAFIAALLSLVNLPTLDYTFGVGIFGADILAALPIGLALLVASRFWHRLEQCSFPNVVLLSALFGGLFSLASYFKDGHAIFAVWTLIAIFFWGCFEKKNLRKLLTFVCVSLVILFSLQLPWRMRNQAAFGEFAMCGSTQDCFALWAQFWGDYKEQDKWCWNGGAGMGSYLAPDVAPRIIAGLYADRKKGNVDALRNCIACISEHPLSALRYKLHAYPTLWLGQRVHIFIYSWCVVSIIAFTIFALSFRLAVGPVLYAFPTLLLCISPVLHYELRYSELFYQFVTPVACALLLQKFAGAYRRKQSSSSLTASTSYREHQPQTK
jgi:hypothetical protein